ncbi:MAG: hypothetical protein PHT30_02315 [Bacilli bacterium]|nr:hypothetical protein [Bacilli bacterium]
MFEKFNRNGERYEVTSMKKNLSYYKRIIDKNARKKDGTAYSDFMRGKASGYIEAAADLSKSRKMYKKLEAEGKHLKPKTKV